MTALRFKAPLHPLTLWCLGVFMGFLWLLSSLESSKMVVGVGLTVVMIGGWVLQKKITWPLIGWFSGCVYGVVVMDFAYLGPHNASPSIQPSQAQILKLSLSKKKALVGGDFHRPRLYRSYFCESSGDQVVSLSQDVVWCEKKDPSPSVRQNFLTKFYETVQAQKYPAMSWVYSTLTGDGSKLHASIKSLLRHWGLLHLQAVSGFHLLLVLAFLKGLWALVRWCGGGQVTLHRGLCGVLELLVLTFWLYLVAFPPSALRAFCCYLSFLILRHSPSSWFPRTPFMWLALPLVLFLWLSPLDFFSVSSVLSWSAYLLLLTLPQLFQSPDVSAKSWKDSSFWRLGLRVVVAFLLLQSALMLLSFLIIGEVSVLSWPAHLLVLPVLVFILKGVVVLQLLGYLVAPSRVMFLVNDYVGRVLTEFFQALGGLSELFFQFTPVMFFSWQLSPSLLPGFLEVSSVLAFGGVFYKVHLSRFRFKV